MTGRIVALSAALLLAAGAGCGQDSDDDGAAVGWQEPPIVAPHPELPDDRIATGKLRNESGSEVRLQAKEARVLDDQGNPMRATVTFAAGATHSLYPPRDAPREDPRKQQERLGFAATIAPGKSVPLTVAWHARDGVAARVDLGGDHGVHLPPAR